MTTTRESLLNVEKLSRWFIVSASCIFLITGLAKLGSLFGTNPEFSKADPVIGIPLRYPMLLAGILECAVSVASLRFKSDFKVGLSLIAWLASTFAVYRLALLSVQIGMPCNCAGKLPSLLHIPPIFADWTIMLLLVYMLLGSYVLLGLSLSRRAISLLRIS